MILLARPVTLIGYEKGHTLFGYGLDSMAPRLQPSS